MKAIVTAIATMDDGENVKYTVTFENNNAESTINQLIGALKNALELGDTVVAISAC